MSHRGSLLVRIVHFSTGNKFTSHFRFVNIIFLPEVTSQNALLVWKSYFSTRNYVMSYFRSKNLIFQQELTTQIFGPEVNRNSTGHCSSIVYSFPFYKIFVFFFFFNAQKCSLFMGNISPDVLSVPSRSDQSTAQSIFQRRWIALIINDVSLSLVFWCYAFLFLVHCRKDTVQRRVSCL